MYWNVTMSTMCVRDLSQKIAHTELSKNKQWVYNRTPVTNFQYDCQKRINRTSLYNLHCEKIYVYITFLTFPTCFIFQDVWKTMHLPCWSATGFPTSSRCEAKETKRSKRNKWFGWVLHWNSISAYVKLSIAFLLVPVQINDDIDSFIYKNKEYLFIGFDFRPSGAALYCAATFQAQPVQIQTEDLALFLADALSETDHALDNVWTGGEKKGDKWIYTASNKAVNETILQKYYMKRENETEFNVTRNCLGFRRNTHNKPAFLSLSCRLPRPPICERKSKFSAQHWLLLCCSFLIVEGAGQGGDQGSTHSGWIKIRDRLYKIYQDKVAWDNATKNCIRHDRNARLAVVVSTRDAEMLARYMTVGRPKIEHAWIGAKWSEDKQHYYFEEEDLLLPNKTDNTTGYPPWRDGEMSRIRRCLLLDRHTTMGGQFEVNFVEARCSRFRPYVCYKMVDEIGSPVFQEDGMRVFYNPKPWGEAKKFCESFSKPGRLPEPRTEAEMNKLLYIMGENFTSIHQTWLNGLYEDEEWKWLSNNTVIPQNEKYPVWLVNDTYTEDVEDNNRCLNLDRENHKVGVFYGADCSYPQRFICYWGE